VRSEVRRVSLKAIESKFLCFRLDGTPELCEGEHVKEMIFASGSHGKDFKDLVRDRE
jgi:hypothetical protein